MFSTECSSWLAPEHACVPLASGHGGSVAALVQGGEVHPSSCAGGAGRHHQACADERHHYAEMVAVSVGLSTCCVCVCLVFE